jgi:hypothetical protein
MKTSRDWSNTAVSQGLKTVTPSQGGRGRVGFPLNNSEDAQLC